MQSDRITELLQPFLPVPLAESQLQDISMYIDILLRWNARINLTAVRQPEEIVTRHFGESLFAARHLFPEAEHHKAAASQSIPRPPQPSAAFEPSGEKNSTRLVDIGSGAGFPGLPIKIWSPHTHVTLIESNHKKATFIREVGRALTLTDVDVFGGRAEDFQASADLVTLRAVERFESVLPVAANLVTPHGRLALLIVRRQMHSVAKITPTFQWSRPAPIPLSEERILISGHQPNHPYQNMDESRL